MPNKQNNVKTKTENKPSAEKELKTGKKSKIGIIIIAIISSVLIGLIVIGLVVKFDIGGFGSKVMTPILKNIPVVKYILPKQTNDAEQNDAYVFESIDAAVESLRATEKLLSNKEEEVEKLNEEIKRLSQEVERLKIIEQKYTTFQEEKKAFDEKVVFYEKAPELEEYKEFYETIYPENAEDIYKKVIEQVVYDDKVKKYANTYQEMKAQNAAAIFEEMSIAELDLVISILENIDTEQKSKILSAMTPQTAAKITKKMSPIEE